MTTRSDLVPGRSGLVLSDLVPAVPRAAVRDAALVVLGAVLTGALAQVSIPVHGSPVPITGQTLGALLVGAALGWRRAFASMSLYLLAGLAGVPWFHDHSSGRPIPPTLGYVIGFVVAGVVVGALAARGGDRTPLRTIATMIIGNAVIYLCGVSYLMHDLNISLQTAWQIGMKNYLLGDAIKVAIAAVVLPGAWKLVGPRRR